MQVLDGSVCAGYVSSRCLGSQCERSVVVREPHRDREALELEEQLQVLAPLPAAAFSFWCICLCLRCCSHLYVRGGDLWQPPLQLLGKNITVRSPSIQRQ